MIRMMITVIVAKQYPDGHEFSYALDDMKRLQDTLEDQGWFVSTSSHIETKEDGKEEKPL